MHVEHPFPVNILENSIFTSSNTHLHVEGLHSLMKVSKMFLFLGVLASSPSKEKHANMDTI